MRCGLHVARAIARALPNWVPAAHSLVQIEVGIFGHVADETRRAQALPAMLTSRDRRTPSGGELRHAGADATPACASRGDRA